MIPGRTGQANRSGDNLNREDIDQQQPDPGGDVENNAISFTHASGSTPLEGYTIKRGIGIGGFGEVYFAISDGGKEVALKRIQRHLDIELRGVRHCLNLKHANLVGIFDIRYDDQDTGWVVMEYVSGQSLKELLDQNPQGLSLDEVAAWIHGITSGVAHLHRHGIVHRDLKPANIFFDDGLVKVGDYGLSKFISCSRQDGQTESVGTFHYMAPEIGKGDYGKQVDVYALGIMLFEMLTGNVPFNGESSQEIIMKHLTDDPDLSGIHSRFQAVIRKALLKDPDKRFEDAQEMLEALPEPDYDKLDLFSRPPRTVNLQPQPAQAASSVVELVTIPQAERQPATTVTRRKRKTVPAKWENLARESLDSTPAAVRVMGLFESMLKSTAISLILTMAIFLVTGLPFDGTPGTMSLFGWLASINLFSCWMILVLAHFWELKSGDQVIRRLVMFIGGVGVGGLAYLTADFLNIPLVHSSTAWPWVVANSEVSLEYFPVTYGALFAIFAWWKQADPLRPIRLSLIDAIACAVVAWLLPIVPFPLGIMMVATVSITVQASAPWISLDQRQHFKVEARYE
jgi:serine/threonine protein kinase